MNTMWQNTVSIKIAVALSAAILFMSACSRPSGDIQVTDAWINTPPAGASVAAAYLTIKNDSASEVTLEQLLSPLFGMVEVHETKQIAGVNGGPGMVSMEPVAELKIAAGDTLTMRPGGMHLMLMMPKKPVTADGHFPLQLSFRRAGAEQIEQQELELHVRSAISAKK